MPAVIITSIWRDMGYYMILFLAGLQTIPVELLRGRRVDGANAWQRFWHVTLPCLRPTTFFVLILLTIGSFKVFDLILVMTDGGPGPSTLVLSQFIYRKGFARERVRLRVGHLRRAVRHRAPRHDPAVPPRRAEGPLMSVVEAPTATVHPRRTPTSRRPARAPPGAHGRACTC